MLQVLQIKASYGSSEVLFDISLNVGEGELVGLLGRNGMGKTTIVNCIMGLLPIEEGEICFNQEDIQGKPSYHIAQAGIGLVPEGRQIFPNLTVRENLIATASNRNAKVSAWSLGEIFDLFPALSLRKNSMGKLLSGGEQQMLAIGRALMTNPSLLILDEATEGLAPKIRAQIWSCLKVLKDGGLSILVIDKNLRDLSEISDKHFIIEKGRTVWSGTPSTLLEDKSLTKRYIGI